MANKLIPVAERNLSPDEVEILDARRRRGQLCLVIGFQMAIVTALLTLWVGQDLTYSPGWFRPMTIWAAFTGVGSLSFLLTGVSLRKGTHEFQSY